MGIERHACARHDTLGTVYAFKPEPDARLKTYSGETEETAISSRQVLKGIARRAQACADGLAPAFGSSIL